MAERVELERVRADRAALASALAAAGAAVNGKASLRCPFHDDKHASGQIKQGNGGGYRFTCHAGCGWNGDKSFGDVFDVLRKARGLDFAAACLELGIESGGNGRATPRPLSKPGSKPDTATPEPSAGTGDVFDAGRYASEAAARLAGDAAELGRLWTGRAVSAETAARLGIGIDGAGRYWTFPVADAAGHVVAVKHHRTSEAVEPKCFWTPKGAESRQLWPVDLKPEGVAWLAPGELKAAACIDAGLAAIGMTGGEAVELPEHVVGLLCGRQVGIVADDDDVGRKWAESAREKLAAAGIDARLANIGLDAADGMKDIGDALVRARVENEYEPEAVRANLQNAFDEADPWRRFTLAGIYADGATFAEVEHVPTGFRELDDKLGGGLRAGAHLFIGKSGKGKTQTAVQVASNAARAGVAVGIVSLEMSRADIAKLLACSDARVARSWVDKGTLRPGASADRFRAALATAAELPLTVLDDDFFDGPVTRSALRAAVAAGVRRFGWRIVVVDYLGLLAPEESDRTEYDSDVKNSTTIKRIAREHNIAMVCIADVRKAAQFKATRSESAKPKPEQIITLDDVRGSARLVYDAVNVLYVHSIQAHNSRKEPTGIITLTALKTRYSGMGARGGAAALRWYPASGHICDLNTGENAAAVEPTTYDPEQD